MAAGAALLTAAVLSVTPGWDFSLPPDVKPLPDVGLLSMDHPTKRPEIIHEGHTLRWADMNPKPGVYDFSKPLRLLHEAQARGKKVLFRMRTFQVYVKTPWGEERDDVPKWIQDQYHPAIADMAAGEDTTYPDCVIKLAVPWDPGVRAEHLKFIAALGKSGIPTHPALLGFYVHGISTSLGEEFWFTRKAFDNLAKAGMTASVLEDSFSERIRAWSAAFGPNAGKLAWVGAGWIEAPDDKWKDYADMGARIDQAALDAGLGWRGGGIETYNQLFLRQGQTEWCSNCCHTGADWKHPLVSGERYFGDENEVYDVTRPWAPYMYRSSVMRALALGMKTLWTSDEAVSLDPDASRFFNLEAGKLGKTARDVWVWCRHAYNKAGRPYAQICGFSHGLLLSIPPGELASSRDFSHFTPRAAMWTDEPWAGAGDSTAYAIPPGEDIRFHLDAMFGFDLNGQDAILKVTWVDRGCDWQVRYDVPGQSVQDGTDADPGVPIDRELRSGPTVHGVPDGIEKTATIKLRGLWGPRIQLLPLQGCTTLFEVSFIRLIR